MDRHVQMVQEMQAAGQQNGVRSRLAVCRQCAIRSRLAVCPNARPPPNPSHRPSAPVGVFTSTTVPFLRYSRPPRARLSTILTL